MSQKLKKSETPRGWELQEQHFQRAIYPKLHLTARIWREEDGLWRPKFEGYAMQNFNVWSAAQVFGPRQKTLGAAISWVKKNSPRMRRKILKATAIEKKKEIRNQAAEHNRKRLDCGCP